MSSLNDVFTGQRRDALYRDVADYVRTTVDKQSGITGMAIKGGLKAAEKAKPNAIELGVKHFLPEALEVLSPYWDSRPEQVSFASHLEAHKAEVADKLMASADKVASKLNYPALNKVYGSLRPRGGKILAENVAGLGEVIERNDT
ncbi:DUF6918 family protein [Corynebacterium epidermidicanis]|uniref:Uncharacterized protein n=1 Tax=Corynebacterium epidermidicanis TaxID=1050174 RepID=A0A0G3GL75_9CORY|nr:hypothetical protein [Corynebacterium epidermidicanis]AKK01909.1 hypothetical protein CEPID_00055 [Corynebacterium epidermidicanis]